MNRFKIYSIYIYRQILNRSTACRCQQQTEITCWLNDRVLKPARKLSLVVIFVPSESFFFLKIAFFCDFIEDYSHTFSKNLKREYRKC